MTDKKDTELISENIDLLARIDDLGEELSRTTIDRDKARKRLKNHAQEIAKLREDIERLRGFVEPFACTCHPNFPNIICGRCTALGDKK